MAIINLIQSKEEKIDRTFILFYVSSLLILLFSFYQQHVAKIQPCFLCKCQRSIYFLIMFIAPIGLISHYHGIIRKLLNAVFLMGIALAFYHTLVQNGWVMDRCLMTEKVENMNDFLQMLEKPTVSCAKMSLKIFGLPASIYNLLILSLALVVLNFRSLLMVYYKRIKNDKYK
jgi:disulfide bond formation protein DsbB